MKEYLRDRKSTVEARPSDSSILLVDDTEAQRYAVARVLRSAGYSVVEASTGEQAYALLESEKPDLAILDVNLPDASGFDICRKIKADGATGSVAVLQISASFVSVRDRVHGLEGGADAYLTPPLDSMELLATVKALLRMRRAEETARREAMQAEHARAELSAVLSSVAEGIAQLDIYNRVVYLNAAGERLLGLQSHKARGREFHELVHGNTEQRFHCLGEHCPLKSVAASGRNGSWETVFQRSDGGWLTVEYTCSALVEAGQITGAVISFRDVSERKRAEEVLRVTEKLATTGRMAATMAHEINNPLEAVTNLLYLIDHHAAIDPTIKRYTNIAQQELSRVAHITRQTLAFYRHSSTPGEVNVVEILDAVLAVYGRRFESGLVVVDRRYEFHDVIEGYVGELRQVFTNLIINALEAVGSKGQVVIHVSPWSDFRGDVPRPGVRISVADDGPGIKPAQREHIFEPFFTTKGEKGTGLGLWVSRGIVQKHGGSISMRSSTEGVPGTVFTVFLPLHSSGGMESDADYEKRGG